LPERVRNVMKEILSRSRLNGCMNGETTNNFNGNI
jgi:hypothetical protein